MVPPAVPRRSARARMGRADTEAALLKLFDKQTLDDAREIIMGTSEWFGFDDSGHLINLMPWWNPEREAQIAGERSENPHFKRMKWEYEEHSVVKGLQRELELSLIHI